MGNMITGLVGTYRARQFEAKLKDLQDRVALAEQTSMLARSAWDETKERTSGNLDALYVMGETIESTVQGLEGASKRDSKLNVHTPFTIKNELASCASELVSHYSTLHGLWKKQEAERSLVREEFYKLMDQINSDDASRPLSLYVDEIYSSSSSSLFDNTELIVHSAVEAGKRLRSRELQMRTTQLDAKNTKHTKRTLFEDVTWLRGIMDDKVKNEFSAFQEWKMWQTKVLRSLMRLFELSHFIRFERWPQEDRVLFETMSKLADESANKSGIAQLLITTVQ